MCAPGPMLKSTTTTFEAEGRGVQSDSWQASHADVTRERAILPPSRDCEGDERRTKPLGLLLGQQPGKARSVGRT